MIDARCFKETHCKTDDLPQEQRHNRPVHYNQPSKYATYIRTLSHCVLKADTFKLVTSIAHKYTLIFEYNT